MNATLASCKNLNTQSPRAGPLLACYDNSCGCEKVAQPGASQSPIEDGGLSRVTDSGVPWPKPVTQLELREAVQHFILDATINGSTPVAMVFDTGMVEGVAVPERIAILLGLKRDRDYDLGGLGHGPRIKAYISQKVIVTMGGVNLNTEILVVPGDSALGRSMCEIDAIVGFSLLDHFVVRVKNY